MITQKILEDYFSCKQALINGSQDKYDKAVCEEYMSFYNFLQRPRDKQICKMRYEMKYSYDLIADKLRFRSGGTIRTRIRHLIAAYNRGEILPKCSTKDILYGYYYANRADKAGCTDEEDKRIIEESNSFFRYLQSARHRSMCELRFVNRRSYKYIAMKLGYCDEGTIRRKINNLIAEYDHAKRKI